MKIKKEITENLTVCPSCFNPFERKRSNQRFCSRSCQKNSSRGTRSVENKARNRKHYERAWDLYNFHLNDVESIQRLLEAAADHDSALRNILLDPRLLDSKDDTISKVVYRFCMENYGCHTKELLLNDGLPSKLKFVGDDCVSENPLIYCVENVVSGNILKDDPVWRNMVLRLQVQVSKRRKKCKFKELPVKQDTATDDFRRVAQIVNETQAKVDQIYDLTVKPPPHYRYRTKETASAL